MIEFEYPTQVALRFAGGVYRFGLPLRQVAEFERNHGSIFAAEHGLFSAIGFDANRDVVFLGGGTVNADLCRDVVRLALIGGNAALVDGEISPVGPQDAAHLVKDYAYPARPLEECAALAWQILSASVYGRDRFSKTLAPAEVDG